MQVKTEKEKAHDAYKLDVRKLIIDKLFLGLIILLLGFAANMALEHYRRETSKQEIFLKKRLEAVNTIQETYATMFDAFDAFTVLGDGTLPENYRKTYKAAVDKFARAQAMWGAPLSRRFNTQLGYHLWTYLAFESKDVAKARAYRAFVYDLNQQFGFLCARELDIAVEQQPLFEFEAWTHEEADRKGAQAFLEANFNKWKTQKQLEKMAASKRSTT
jgi:hypothetical protein